MAHVGDSHCYRLRSGALEPLTEDHSLGNALRHSSAITDAEVEKMGNRHSLVRAVGTRSRVEIDIFRGAWEPNDLFLLCSDGLTNMLTEAEIHAIMLFHADDPEAMTADLIERANRAGGCDNITCVVVRIPQNRTEPYRPWLLSAAPVLIAA